MIVGGTLGYKVTPVDDEMGSAGKFSLLSAKGQSYWLCTIWLHEGPLGLLINCLSLTGCSFRPIYTNPVYQSVSYSLSSTYTLNGWQPIIPLRLHRNGPTGPLAL